MERGRVAVTTLVLLLVSLAGCLVSPDHIRQERVDLMVNALPGEAPVEPRPVTNDEIDGFPEFRRALDGAVENGSSYTKIPSTTSDEISAIIGDSPVYAAGSSRYRPNGTYLAIDGAIVLVRTDDARREILVRPYPNRSSATVNRIKSNDLRNVSPLRNVTQQSLNTGAPVTRELDEDGFSEVQAFLDRMAPYRARYNHADYWGRYVRYRNTTLVVSQRFDTGA